MISQLAILTSATSEDLSFEADSDVTFDGPFVVSIQGPGLKFELVAVTRDTDDGGTIMGDPHFFVGSSLYDWKQVRAHLCGFNCLL